MEPFDKPFPSEWHEVVRARHKHVVGFVVAESGSCLEYQVQETTTRRGRVPGRTFQPLSADELEALRPPSHWFLGIILCPGDSVEPYAKWYADLDAASRARVAIFVHGSLRTDDLDEAWERFGAPLPEVYKLPPTWERFHKMFGRLHGDRAYRDFPPTARASESERPGR